MGADNLHIFHSWQHAEELAEICPLNVYPRPGYPKPKEPIPFNAKWFEAPLLDISATQIRDLLWNVDVTSHNTEEILQTLVPQEIIEDLTSFFQTIKP
jgi:nicotinic acid mononucleotide adenylyltransferase